MAKITAKKIPYENGYFYKKGDTLTLDNTKAVNSGYVANASQIYVTIITNRPILASGATVSLTGNLGLATTNGLISFTNLSISNVSVSERSVNLIINGTADVPMPTAYTPLVVGVSGTITFT